MSHDVSETLKEGKKILIQYGISPREARLLLAHSMGISSNDIVKYKQCSEEDYIQYIKCTMICHY